MERLPYRLPVVHSHIPTIGKMVSPTNKPRRWSRTYAVTVTDANNQTGLGNATVTEPNPFVANITASGLSCDGTSGVLTATGSAGLLPFGYSWSTQETTQSIQVTGPTTILLPSLMQTAAQMQLPILLPIRLRLMWW